MFRYHFVGHFFGRIELNLSVQGMNEGHSSVTFVNKTGVAHFTLQFWQLNKTDHFLYVCFVDLGPPPLKGPTFIIGISIE